MATAVKWIKICTDIFDDEKILLIEGLPDADKIIVIWFKLLCLAGKQNNSGIFMMNEKIAYTDEMLAVIFRRSVKIVKKSLKIFNDYGMIEIIDGAITIPGWEKHQNLKNLERNRDLTRQRVAAYRERTNDVTHDVTHDVTQCNTDVTPQNKNKNEIKIKIKKEIYKERKPENEAAASPAHKYGEYKNVVLSDEDLEKLKSEFPDWQQRIERLSEYIASSGKKYKSHLATIRSWARKDKAKPGGKKPEINASESERLSAEIMARELEERTENDGLDC